MINYFEYLRSLVQSDAKRLYTPFVREIFCFGLVGVTAAGIHFSVVVLLVQIYKLLPLVANIFGFLVAFQMSYWGNRLWTFSKTEALHRVVLPKLLLVQVLNFLANEFLFYILLSLNIPYPIALIFVIIVLSVFTFASNKLWVFR